MKTVMAAMILSSILQTLSLAAPKDRSAKVVCKVVTPKNHFKKTIILLKLDTQSPDTNIRDARLVDELDEKKSLRLVWFMFF